MAAVDPWQLQADPEWAVAIVVAAVDYALVVRTLGRRGDPTPVWRRACFGAGLALIAIGLLSPLEHIALSSLLLQAPRSDARRGAAVLLGLAALIFAVEFCPSDDSAATR